MQVFRQVDIIKSINEIIDSDPLIKKIKLDEMESVDFLDEVPRLYNLGLLDMDSKLEKTEYYYRKVLIEVTENAKVLYG